MQIRCRKVIVICITLILTFNFHSNAYAEEYEYDDLNRIIKVTYEDGSYVEYEYDRNGNIIKTTVYNQNEEEETSNTDETKNSDETIQEEVNDTFSAFTEAISQVVETIGNVLISIFTGISKFFKSII